MKSIWPFFEPCSDSELNNFTDRGRLVMALAYQFAQYSRSTEIAPEHALRAIVSADYGTAQHILKALSIEPLELLPALVSMCDDLRASNESEEPIEDPSFKGIVSIAKAASLNFGHSYMGTEHLLLAIVAIDTSPAARMIIDRGATAEVISKTLLGVLPESG
jgi:ATP-dependent Clp protease ATP-binding subunit ClpA